MTLNLPNLTLLYPHRSYVLGIRSSWVVRGLSPLAPLLGKMLFFGFRPIFVFRHNIVTCIFDVTSFDMVTFDITSFQKTSFDKTSFDRMSFDKTSCDKTSFDKTSFDTTSFDTTSFDTTSFDKTLFDKTSFDIVTFDITSFDKVRIDIAVLSPISSNILLPLLRYSPAERCSTR